MINKNHIIALLILAMSILELSAQDKAVSLNRSLSAQLDGFIRPEFIYDTRKNAEALDGLVSLYPLGKDLDADGKDINDQATVSMSSITTRFITRLTGPNIGNVKTQGFVEFDFTATSNSNSVRFRQGWLSLNWPKSQILLGRTWHPLAYYSNCTALGINYGAPFYLFNRSDQIKFTYNPGNFTFAIAAAYQGDYASLGPQGKSISYMRNALVPDMSVIAQYKNDNFTLGGVFNTKTIRPRNITSGDDLKRHLTKETLTTYSAQAFMEYRKNDFSLKLNQTYMQNMTESLTLGGYAVSSFDPITGFETYTPSKHTNTWINIEHGSKFVLGLFGGYIHNLGTTKNVVGDSYMRGGDIASLWRVAPHAYYMFNNIQVGCELEYTSAEYGTPDKNDHYKVKDTYSVGNMRFNIMAIYLF